MQTVQGSFADLTNPVVGLNTLTIPVPSRLYTKYLDNPRPLEGLRIGIKDLFDMAGLKTSGGSRAYFNTYPVKEVNSDVVQRLVDQVGWVAARWASDVLSRRAVSLSEGARRVSLPMVNPPRPIGSTSSAPSTPEGTATNSLLRLPVDREPLRPLTTGSTIRSGLIRE